MSDDELLGQSTPPLFRDTDRPTPAPRAVAVVSVLLIAVSVSSVVFTGKFEYFIWLTSQAFSLVIWLWPVTYGLTIAAVCSLLSIDRDEFNARSLLFLLPLIGFPFVILAWGAVFTHSLGDEYPFIEPYPSWQLHAVHLMWLVNLPLAILAVVFNAGQRMFVAFAAAFLFLVTSSSTLTAVMSVTGDWL